MAIFARKAVDSWPGNVDVLTVAGILGIPVGALLGFAGNNLPGMGHRRSRQLRALAESTPI